MPFLASPWSQDTQIWIPHGLKSRFADFGLEICDSNFVFAVTIIVGSFKVINRHDFDFSFCSRSARLSLSLSVRLSSADGRKIRLKHSPVPRYLVGGLSASPVITGITSLHRYDDGGAVLRFLPTFFRVRVQACFEQTPF